MQRLELKIPPVLIFLIGIGLIFWSDSSTSLDVSLPFPWLVFGVCFIASGYFGLSGIYQFKQAKTTVNPVDIHKTSTIVDSGVYRTSRNPMYFGLLLLLIGYGYLQQNWLCLLIPLLFIAYMNRYQIGPEERHLEARFGDEYRNYKQKVRRWI